MARVGPCTIEPDEWITPFAYLVRSIVYQQLHGAAARAIHGRLLARFGDMAPEPAALLATDAATLRLDGISAGKAAALHDLARHALAGEVPSADEADELDDDELVRRLVRVRGVGPWTVHMLLIFRLARPDVLPVGDFGVREGYRLLAGADRQPTPGELTRVAEPWRPWRSIAAWYLWRQVDLVRAGDA